MDEYASLFNSLHTLVLYDVNEPSNPMKRYRLSNPRKFTGAELNDMLYPDTKPKNEYEVFEIGNETAWYAKQRDLVASLMGIPGHLEGAPVILTE